MKPILTAQAMQHADSQTIEQFGIPSFTLMESAGREAVSYIEEYFGKLYGKVLGILCGKGNNGGDGLVIARTLLQKGATVFVVFVGNPEKATSDTKKNLNLVKKLLSHHPTSKLIFFAESESFPTHPVDLWIDALLGTGLTTAPKPPYDTLIHFINRQKVPIISIDIPSGLDSTSGLVFSEAIEASLTVSMGATKTGHWLENGPDTSGKVEVAEICIPNFLLEDATKFKGCCWLPESKDIAHFLPIRPRSAHKYSVGYLLAWVGSKGFTGAAMLATNSATSVGAGGVICACPNSVQPILATKLTTAMPLGLEETEGIYSEETIKQLERLLPKVKALLIGCGFGRNEQNLSLLRKFFSQMDKPLVLDADGLYAFVGYSHQLAKFSKQKWILTPHWGEFTALAGLSKDPTQNRITLVQEYAQKWQCTILLKGFPSLISSPDGTVYLNPTGNSAAASAGTGDVLAGSIAGLLAQGLSPTEATLTGMYLNGLASETYVENNPPQSFTADKVITLIPQVWYSLLKEKNN